jgi:hypothetical protein
LGGNSASQSIPIQSILYKNDNQDIIFTWWKIFIVKVYESTINLILNVYKIFLLQDHFFVNLPTNFWD